MPKVKITIITREEAVLDTGDLPTRLIAHLLEEGEGAFGKDIHSWGLSDVGSPSFTVDSITVEEVTTKAAASTKKK